mmetsp:Transcript_38772/g.82750  ORF Transcript_38772/g.82750 Transcript_38772/m.82750 type:complete len:406 (-) Transcript_38772:294-1511(-)
MVGVILTSAPLLPSEGVGGSSIAGTLVPPDDGLGTKKESVAPSSAGASLPVAAVDSLVLPMTPDCDPSSDLALLSKRSDWSPSLCSLSPPSTSVSERPDDAFSMLASSSSVSSVSSSLSTTAPVVIALTPWLERREMSTPPRPGCAAAASLSLCSFIFSSVALCSFSCCSWNCCWRSRMRSSMLRREAPRPRMPHPRACLVVEAAMSLMLPLSLPLSLSLFSLLPSSARASLNGLVVAVSSSSPQPLLASDAVDCVPPRSPIPQPPPFASFFADASLPSLAATDFVDGASSRISSPLESGSPSSFGGATSASSADDDGATSDISCFPAVMLLSTSGDEANDAASFGVSSCARSSSSLSSSSATGSRLAPSSGTDVLSMTRSFPPPSSLSPPPSSLSHSNESTSCF